MSALLQLLLLPSLCLLALAAPLPPRPDTAPDGPPVSVVGLDGNPLYLDEDGEYDIYDEDDDDEWASWDELEESEWLAKVFMVTRVEPPVETIMLPLNFPLRRGDPATSPPDRPLPLINDSVSFVIPQCAHAVYMVTQLQNRASSPGLMKTLDLTTVDKTDLRVTVRWRPREAWGMAVHIRCYDYKKRQYPPNPDRHDTWDPHHTYIFAIRPNYHNMDWFWNEEQGFTAHMGQDFTKVLDVDFGDRFLLLPLFNTSEFSPPPLPDNIIWVSEHAVLSAYFDPCYESRVTVEDYSDPGRYGKYFRWQMTPDVTVMSWPDVDNASLAFYYLDCKNTPEAADWEFRYTALRPLFRNNNIGAIRAMLEIGPAQVPLFTYANGVFAYFWQVGDYFVKGVYKGQNLALEYSSPSGLNSLNLTLLSEVDGRPHDMRNGTTVAGAHLGSRLSFDGQVVKVTLLAVNESFFGNYTLTLTFHNGSHLAARQYHFFLQPNISTALYDEMYRNNSRHRAPQQVNPFLDPEFTGPVKPAESRGALGRGRAKAHAAFTGTTSAPTSSTVVSTACPDPAPSLPQQFEAQIAPPPGNAPEETQNAPAGFALWGLVLAVAVAVSVFGLVGVLVLVRRRWAPESQPEPPSDPRRRPIYVPSNDPHRTYASVRDLFPHCDTPHPAYPHTPLMQQHLYRLTVPEPDSETEI